MPRPRHDLRDPAEGHAAARGRRPRQGSQDPDHPRAARSGSLSRRAAADDGQGHVHHQRHRARRGQPAPALGRRVLRRRQGQDAGLRASRCSRPASSPTAARGWSSTSTPTTSCTSGSTGGARCYATAFLRAFWFLEKGVDPLRRGDPRPVLRDRGGAGLRGRQRLGQAAAPRRTSEPARRTTSRPPRHREPLVQAGKVLNAEARREAGRGRRREDPVGPRRSSAAAPAAASSTRRAARCWSTATRRSPPPLLAQIMAAGWRRSSCWCIVPGQGRRLDLRDAGARPLQEPRRGAGRDLPHACARAIRPPSSRRAPCSAACSWTRAATTWPASAAS